MEALKQLLEGIRNVDYLIHTWIGRKFNSPMGLEPVFKEVYPFLSNFNDLTFQLRNELDYIFLQSSHQGLKNHIDVLLIQAKSSYNSAYAKISKSLLPIILQNHRLKDMLIYFERLEDDLYIEAYAGVLWDDMKRKMNEEKFDEIDMQHLYVCFVDDLIYLINLLEQRLAELPEDIQDLQSIDNPRGKLILLYELGLLDVLMENYKYLKPADLARLICLVTGITNEKQAGTLSRQMFAVYNDGLTSGKGGKPINDTSVSTPFLRQ